MNRNKIIDISFFLRTVFLTAMLCLSLHIGIFSHVVPGHSIHFVPAQNLLISAFLFVLVAQTSVYKLVSQIWNKITPLKDKPTFIETEIVYILSVLLGIPIFSAVFLKTTISDLPTMLSVIFLAALPGSICAYTLQRFNKETMLAPHIEESAPKIKEYEFNPSEFNIMAYLVASIIFALSLTISTGFVAYLKTGWQPSVLYPIVLSIASLCGSSILLLTLFGHVILPFGTKVKTIFGLTINDTRVGIASTWCLSIMLMLTICIVLFGNVRLPHSMEDLMSSLHLWLTYGLFGLSSFLGGLALRSFYKPKPISTVFA